jgi:hypothetical protein
MKIIYSIILASALLLNAKAQTPQGINYQGVARNAAGTELLNQAIGLELSILDGSPSGTIVYTETHNKTTDANGLFTLVIGQGTPTLGTFSGINWGAGNGKFLKVSMDASGGTSYTLLGTSQMMSVPYALFAGNVTNNGGKQTVVLSDDVTDAQAATIIANEVGPNTQEIKIVGTTQLTTVNLSGITTAIGIQVANNSALTTLDLSGLLKCDGTIEFVESPLLSNLNISNLAKVTAGDLVFSNLGITSLNLPNLVKVNGGFNLNNNNNLTSINIPNLSSVFYSQISKNNALTNLTLPALTQVTQGLFSIGTHNLLTSISAPLLTSVFGEFIINRNTVLTSINFPVINLVGSFSFQENPAMTSLSLAIALANFTSSSINVNNNILLTSVTFPNLTNAVSGFSFGTNPVLTSLNFPSLTSTRFINISQCPLVTTVSLPVLASLGVGSPNNVNNGSTSFAALGCDITNFSLPSLTTFFGSLSLQQNNLTSSDVNALLAKLVAITPNISGRGISLSLQSPAAPPTGQGITDKATLIANGNTVSTD